MGRSLVEDMGETTNGSGKKQRIPAEGTNGGIMVRSHRSQQQHSLGESAPVSRLRRSATTWTQLAARITKSHDREADLAPSSSRDAQRATHSDSLASHKPLSRKTSTMAVMISNSASSSPSSLRPPRSSSVARPAFSRRASSTCPVPPDRSSSILLNSSAPPSPVFGPSTRRDSAMRPRPASSSGPQQRRQNVPTSLSTSSLCVRRPQVGTENVSVTVRLRPLASDQQSTKQGTPWVVDMDHGTVSLVAGGAKPTSSGRAVVPLFAFDHVYEGSDNMDIYKDVVKPLVHSCLQGYHGTVFAYGQTSSGKTYTMTGTSEQPGVIPLAIHELFSCISKPPHASSRFEIKVSYLEIYNETIIDLLNNSQSTLEPQIREGKRHGIVISPLTEQIVTSSEEALDVMRTGNQSRHIEETEFNDRSSRSHAIFRITVTGSNLDRVITSQLSLIDLAGSEKASNNRSRRKEGSFINRSLLTLGTVISKLSAGASSAAHVPYRDSKLTRILQPSLSGKSRVAVICTISCSMANIEETLNTLKFASRAKRITVKPELEKEWDEKGMIRRLQRENGELRMRLSMIASRSPYGIFDQDGNDLSASRPRSHPVGDRSGQEIQSSALNPGPQQQATFSSPLSGSFERLSVSSVSSLSRARKSRQDSAFSSCGWKDEVISFVLRKDFDTAYEILERNFRASSWSAPIQSAKQVRSDTSPPTTDLVAKEDARPFLDSLPDSLESLSESIAQVESPMSTESLGTPLRHGKCDSTLLPSQESPLSTINMSARLPQRKSRSPIALETHTPADNLQGASGKDDPWFQRVRDHPSESTKPTRNSSLSELPSLRANHFSNTGFLGAGNQGGNDYTRTRELELLILKERKIRAVERARYDERIAALEAEVTITKAELSVAQLMTSLCEQ